MRLINKIKNLFIKDNGEPKKSDEEWKPAYESDYKGVIGHFNLDNWWENEFSEEEKKIIISKKPEIIKGTYNYTDKSIAQYLQELSLWFNTKKESNISLKLLDQAEKLVNDKQTLHFMYNSKIKSLYKKRKKDEVYLKQCIEYCKKDIELYEKKLSKISFFKDNNTRIPAFQRLAIIYEKKGEYKKAIEVSKKAIKYNMSEKKKVNFEDRLLRLESKINS